MGLLSACSTAQEAGRASAVTPTGVAAVPSEEAPSARPTAEPVFAPDEPPEDHPPLDVSSSDGMQPGTVLFTTFTSPRAPEDAETWPAWLHVVDKSTGDVVRAQRSPANATMFQPHGDGRFSFNTVDVPGTDGAGFTVTHYLVDDRFEVLEDFSWPASQEGPADLHDFELLDNGNALLMAYREREVDLTEFGGRADGRVYDTVIAERTPDGRTVWLWDGAEHIDLADAAANVPDEFTRTEGVTDYAHPNSLELFDDGDVLVSIRHTDCLLRIDRDTGDVVWTMGGPNCADNDFDFVDDPHDGFSHQHDATILDDGNILLFDNGNLREDPVSRVVEYEVDTDAMTATLVWSYDDDRYTAIMGSAERLTNGNTLIGWGALHDPAISEVTRDGEQVFSIAVPEHQLVYRAYQGGEAP